MQEPINLKKHKKLSSFSSDQNAQSIQGSFKTFSKSQIL